MARARRVMVAAASGPSCRGAPTSRCAGPATTGPSFGPRGSAGCADASVASACTPRRPAPTSASTATPCPRACASAAGGPGPAPEWRPARRGVFVASPGPALPAPTVASFGRRRSAGPRGRCATPATTPPSAGGACARIAESSDGSSHRPVAAPPGVATARDWPRCTPARSAALRTSSMSGAAANDAPSPGAAPKP